MEQPFTVHLRLCGDTALVTPRGSLDRVADVVLDRLLWRFGPAVNTVFLDMGAVPRMSVAGLGLLERLLAYGAEHGSHVVTVGWQPQPRGVLGARADRFVPPAAASHGAGTGELVRAVQARALAALARGASSGDRPKHGLRDE